MYLPKRPFGIVQANDAKRKLDIRRKELIDWQVERIGKKLTTQLNGMLEAGQNPPFILLVPSSELTGFEFVPEAQKKIINVFREAGYTVHGSSNGELFDYRAMYYITVMFY